MAEEGLTLVCHSLAALEWQTSVSPSNPLKYDKHTDSWQKVCIFRIKSRIATF